MSLENEIYKITNTINRLHVEDPKITDYWDELTTLLIKDEEKTLAFLDTLTDKDIAEDLSSVFEEVAAELQSKNFIRSIEKLEEKLPDANIGRMVIAAKKNMDD